jgi:hypothetical protein
MHMELDRNALAKACAVARAADDTGCASLDDCVRKAIKEYLWAVHPDHPENLARRAYEVGE